jgi:hypothetical protein
MAPALGLAVLFLLFFQAPPGAAQWTNPWIGDTTATDTTADTTAAELSAPAGERQQLGKVSIYIGDVRVRPMGREIWDKPGMEHPIYQGDALRAGPESRAEVTLSTGDVIRIGEQSIFEFDDLAIADGEVEGEANLPFGKFWSRVKSLGDDGMAVRSPNAVMAVRGTTWRADAGRDSSLSVRVYDGQVDVNSLDEGGQIPPPPEPPPPPGQPQPIQAPTPVPGPYQVSLDEWVQLTAGGQLTLRPDGRFDTQQFDRQQDAEDPWVQWNQQRDDELFGQ